MSKSLCMIPFINLSPRPDGRPKVCSDGMHKFVPTDVNLNEQDVETFWNGEFMKQIRMDMIEGRMNPHCEWCHNVEKSGGKSKRLHINKRFLEENRHKIEDAKLNDGHLSYGPSAWEFRFSSVCNNACLTCAPTNSTLIEKQFRTHFDELPEWDQLIIKGLDKAKKCKTADNSHFLQELWKYMPNINRIELHGGEPFYDPKSLAILNEIIDSGHSSHIDLLVHSNMTNFNDDMIDMLNKFHKVVFRASIDGFAEENDFLRWPSKWDNVVHNLQLVDTKLNSEIKFVSGVLSVYNCLSLHKLYAWLVEEFPHWAIDWAPAYLPKRFGVNMIDLEKRKEAVEKIESLSPKMNQRSRDDFKRIKKILLFDGPPKEQEIIDFVDYVKVMDRIRNQDSLKLFPHLQEVFDSYQSIKARV